MISERDYEVAALSLKCEVAALKAVASVESSGKGFTKDGEPVILFEGHVFWKELIKKGINPHDHLEGNEDILYQRWTRKHYGNTGSFEGNQKEEQKRLAKACKIDKEAALRSASWGAFQVMGNNAESLGYKDVFEFFYQMKIGELQHLQSFIRFVKHNGLVSHLRSKDWARFARGYNGRSYAKNKYDIKMAEAYNRYK